MYISEILATTIYYRCYPIVTCANPVWFLVGSVLADIHKSAHLKILKDLLVGGGAAHACQELVSGLPVLLFNNIY